MPHNRSRLAEVLGTDGVIYKTRSEYCRAVDDQLFRLRDRYRALVDLLIQLRVPQLSRDFDEKRISTQLSDALPPLAPEVLDQVAGAMRDLDEQRARLEEMRRSAAAVERFESHYAGYLRIVLKRRVSDFFIEHNKYDRTQRKINEDLRLLEDAKTRYENADVAITKNRTDAAAIEARLSVLRQSPEMKDARRLDDYRKRRDQTSEQSEASAVRLREDEHSLKQARESFRQTSEQLRYDRRKAVATIAEMVARETPKAIAQSIEDCRGGDDDELAGTKQLDRIGKAIDQTSAGAEQLRNQQQRVDAAERELQRAVDRRGHCERQADNARSRVAQAVEQLRRHRDQLCQAWLAWHDDAAACLPSLPAREVFQERTGLVAPSSDAAIDADQEDGLFVNPSVEIRDTVQSALDTASTLAQQARATLIVEISKCNANLDETKIRLAELKSGTHLPPDPLPTRRDRCTRGSPGRTVLRTRSTSPPRFPRMNMPRGRPRWRHRACWTHGFFHSTKMTPPIAGRRCLPTMRSGMRSR